MEAKFQPAHYDSADPLSARAFQAWRDGEPEKQDEVSTVADPQDSVRKLLPHSHDRGHRGCGRRDSNAPHHGPGSGGGPA